MIEQTNFKTNAKKTSKKPKKPQQKMVEEPPQYIQKIQEEGKEISEMSEPNQEEEKKKAANNLHELFEDLIAFLLLDHEQFKDEIQETLNTLSTFNMQKITHKSIMAYSFWAKITFIEKRLAQSHLLNSYSVDKPKQTLRQIFKTGIRSFDHMHEFLKELNN